MKDILHSRACKRKNISIFYFKKMECGMFVDDMLLHNVCFAFYDIDNTSSFRYTVFSFRILLLNLF